MRSAEMRWRHHRHGVTGVKIAISATSAARSAFRLAPAWTPTSITGRR
jgi:hypothetical protein